MYKGVDPEKPRILLLVPTVNETTIHSGLGINIVSKLYPLSDRHRAELRNRLSEVRLLIIDAISMGSSVLFFSSHPAIKGKILIFRQ